MLSENGDVIKYTRPGTRPLDCEYPKWQTDATMWLQFAPILLADILKCPCVKFILSMHIEGIKSFSKRIRHCSVDGRK